MWDGIYLCVALGVVMEVTFRLVHVALRAQPWYAHMDSVRRSLFSRHVTTILHHLLVVSGAAISLHYHSRYVFQLTLYLEAAFDVVDSVRGGLLTGMRGIPLLLHHGVAIGLELAWLLQPLGWENCSILMVTLLGTGAIDLFMVKIVPRTPLGSSSALIYMAVLQFVAFLLCRVVIFFYIGRLVITEAFGLSAELGWAVSACWIAMTLYHALLALGMVLSLCNGGKWPSFAGSTKPQVRPLTPEDVQENLLHERDFLSHLHSLGAAAGAAGI
mmetsp:Transcript_10381/g.31961  ORF Transcript_10381/g.31961 Transcript_10381/m.31961 type:complete len:272 (+) Transcript_10381:211-1026(+)|eukprot:CAMPEP_0177680806 /NCGR_PEP_ID=MMETSP0447-20121125/30370_1 /TAXON_ID=0 /ORGANISM="Stygamoeba regulata, Strain BSH-02190019" /LENGTH=271 /DNA_ID=CAMNT_0019190163 /DNA_START=197 /DNA_END=1012 /DNA_ORIENTATION=+